MSRRTIQRFNVKVAPRLEPLTSARQTKSKIEKIYHGDFLPLYNISEAHWDRLMLSASNVC